MSADNHVWIRETPDGKWWVKDIPSLYPECAKTDADLDGFFENATVYDTQDDAEAAADAYLCDENNFVEYGIAYCGRKSVCPGCGNGTGQLCDTCLNGRLPEEQPPAPLVMGDQLVYPERMYRHLYQTAQAFQEWAKHEQEMYRIVHSREDRYMRVERYLEKRLAALLPEDEMKQVYDDIYATLKGEFLKR